MSSVPTPGATYPQLVGADPSANPMLSDIQKRLGTIINSDGTGYAQTTYAQAITVLNTLLSTIDMTEVWNIVQQGLDPVSLQILNNPFPMTVPTSPVRPDFYPLPELTTTPAMPTFNLNLFTYDSALLDTLVAVLTNDLQTGATGFTAALEAEEFAANQLRLQIIYQQKQDQINTVLGAMGWDLPQGSLIGLTQEAQNDYNRDLAVNSAQIDIESFKLAQANTWKARDTSVEVERLRSGFILEAAKTAVLVFQAELSYIATWVELNLGEAKIVTAYNQDLTMVYEADTKVYEVIIQALVQQFDALLKQNTEQANVALEMDKIAESAGTTLYGVQKEILKAVAQVFSQIVASWLGAGQIAVTGTYHEAKSDSTSAGVSAGGSTSESTTVNISTTNSGS